MATFVKTPRNLPTVQNFTQLQQYLVRWKTSMRLVMRSAVPPPPPLNFQAKGIRGANVLSWSEVQTVSTKGILGTVSSGPDGYEILKSASGDFTTDLVVIPIRDPKQTQYIDSVGGDPTKVSYKIHTTAGTIGQPHSVSGPDSGTVTQTSLDSADMSAPTTVFDNWTNDFVRATARVGRYL